MVLSREMDSFVASQIARINRNLLLVALGLGAAAGLILWLGRYEVLGVVRGPRIVTAQELVSPRFQSDPEAYKAVVQVSGSQMGGPFLSERVRRGKSTSTLYCALLKLETGRLIVESWDPLTAATVAGKVKEPAGHIWRAARAHNKEGDLLPVALDTRDWKSNGWVLLGAGGGSAVATLAIAGLLFYWTSTPDRHPAQKAVARLGDFASVAMQIDGDMQAEVQRFGSVHLGQTFALYTSTFKFDVVRLDSIVGARTQWVQQGKSRALFLFLDTNQGREVKWHIAKKNAEELLASVRRAARLEQNVI